MKIINYEKASSTNEIAKAHNEAFSVIIAEQQTDGYGKYGRSFYSPQGGIYMSVILPLERTPAEFTMMAAVAVCHAIETVCNNKVQVKWVNDIILNDKKVGGILTESCGKNAIIGIGLNVFTKEFPSELSNAGSIFEYEEFSQDIKKELLKEIINNIADIWEKKQDIYREYKSRLILMGQKVLVTEGNESYEAIVVDLDFKAHLVVEKTDGTRCALLAGEIEKMKG